MKINGSQDGAFQGVRPTGFLGEMMLQSQGLKTPGLGLSPLLAGEFRGSSYYCVYHITI